MNFINIGKQFLKRSQIFTTKINNNFLLKGEQKLLPQFAESVAGGMATDVGVFSKLKKSSTLNKSITNRITHRMDFRFPFKDVASALGWPLAGIGIGQIASSGFGVFFNSALIGIDYLQTVSDNMRALEMGGTLTVGYLTQESATERSKVLSALRNSSEGRRRNLGNEASMYAGM